MSPTSRVNKQPNSLKINKNMYYQRPSSYHGPKTVETRPDTTATSKSFTSLECTSRFQIEKTSVVTSNYQCSFGQHHCEPLPETENSLYKRTLTSSAGTTQHREPEYHVKAEIKNFKSSYTMEEESEKMPKSISDIRKDDAAIIAANADIAVNRSENHRPQDKYNNFESIISNSPNSFHEESKTNRSVQRNKILEPEKDNISMHYQNTLPVNVQNFIKYMEPGYQLNEENRQLKHPYNTEQNENKMPVFPLGGQCDNSTRIVDQNPGQQTKVIMGDTLSLKTSQTNETDPYLAKNQVTNAKENNQIPGVNESTEANIKTGKKMREHKIAIETNLPHEIVYKSTDNCMSVESIDKNGATWKFGSVKGLLKFGKSLSATKGQETSRRIKSVPCKQSKPTVCYDSNASPKSWKIQSVPLKEIKPLRVRQLLPRKKCQSQDNREAEEKDLHTIMEEVFSISENYRLSELVLDPILLTQAMVDTQEFIEPKDGNGTPNKVNVTPLQCFRTRNSPENGTDCPTSNTFEGERLRKPMLAKRRSNKKEAKIPGSVPKKSKQLA